MRRRWRPSDVALRSLCSHRACSSASRWASPARASSSNASEQCRSLSAALSRCWRSPEPSVGVWQRANIDHAFHSGVATTIIRRRHCSPMHTPAEFVPAHAMPQPLAEGALAFAYRDTKLLVGGEDEAPTVPTVATLARAGVDGTMHYLGELAGTPCVAVSLPDDAPDLPGHRYAGLRSLFFKLPESLLARANRFPGAMYSALAGFVEPGETIEDCIRREVREEVGVEVAGITYFASQSWAFPHSLMIAYTAEYAGGELNPDRNEIADAQWFALDALPALPSHVSIARRLIDATIARRA